MHARHHARFMAMADNDEGRRGPGRGFPGHEHPDDPPRGRGRPGGGGRRGGWGGPPADWFGEEGGPRGRRGPRRNRGDVRAAILLLLAEQPMHGYELIRQAAIRSQDTWRLSPGAVYPALALLADAGMIIGSENEGRTVYSLTEAGQRAAAEIAAAGPAPWAAVAEDGQLDDYAEAAKALMAAMRQVAMVGSPEVRAEALATLVETRKALYAMLAR